MTVEELYTMAKSRMFEKPSSTIYDPYLMGNVNRLIYELYEENQMERMFNGKEPLKKIPYVSQRTDELAYEENIINSIMPIGLAAYFFIDDDLSKYSIYITDYKNARILNQKIVSQEVIDGITRNTKL